MLPHGTQPSIAEHVAIPPHSCIPYLLIVQQWRRHMGGLFALPPSQPLIVDMIASCIFHFQFNVCLFGHSLSSFQQTITNPDVDNLNNACFLITNVGMPALWLHLVSLDFTNWSVSGMLAQATRIVRFVGPPFSTSPRFPPELWAVSYCWCTQTQEWRFCTEKCQSVQCSEEGGGRPSICGFARRHLWPLMVVSSPNHTRPQIPIVGSKFHSFGQIWSSLI